jgi:hypothetical protein
MKKHSKDKGWPKHCDIDYTTITMSGSVEKVKACVEYYLKILV